MSREIERGRERGGGEMAAHGDLDRRIEQLIESVCTGGGDVQIGWYGRGL